MDSRQSGVSTPSSDSRDTNEPAPPGIPESEHQLQALDPNKKKSPLKPQLTLKGIENAKKRLRAFSIQKRAPLSPVPVVKASTSSTSNTVLIGKLSSIKPSQPKVEDPDVKKPPKPPKPGKRVLHGTDSYHELQKKTLSEIEDMKRKMELVELGIPLGLICPTSAINEKAMPTKAMPPIKSFLDPKKVDEIIREAQKAKAEGKEFKFDYNRLLPDYDNPFQRKKDDETKKEEEKPSDKFRISDKYKSKRSKNYDKSHSRRYLGHKKDDRSRHGPKSAGKSSEADVANKNAKSVEKDKEIKDPDDDLKGYVVCDSWSLENDEKTNSSSPKVSDKPVEDESHLEKNVNESALVAPPVIVDDPELPIQIDELHNDPLLAPKKMEKLQPVIDSFKFEIDEPNEDDMIDLYDIPLPKKSRFESPSSKNLDDDQSKESANDDMNDDTFLESIINEIKKENIDDDDDLSPEKGLVEYEISPPKDEDFSNNERLGSITPELDESMRELQFSQRSNYSDGYRSGESGYKSTESGYKSGRSSQSSENYRMSMEKDLEDTMDSKITKATAESLETWSFVLKICQPLLFRHDKNKCYKETRSTPKLWYTESAKHCHCVKDRMIVYSELDSCKTSLVEALYGCDQLSDSSFPTARSWYPQKALESTEGATVPVASEWEDDTVSFGRREQSGVSQSELRRNQRVEEKKTEERRDETQDEMSLDTEYQRFMESVWPAVANKADSRSTTPTQDAKQTQKETEDKRKGKKVKLSSEGWSQESDVEEQEVSKKPKSKEAKEKSRKRKLSASPLSSQSEAEETPKKKKKSDKKKSSFQEKKRSKSKLSKPKRNERKMKKLKEKHKKKKKSLEPFVDDNEKENKKKDHKKSKKKKQQKLKKKDAKKKKAKAKSSSSESSSSSTETSSDTESSAEVKRKKKKKDAQTRKKKKDKKHNALSSESQHSEDLFDVNILKNIKKERETDDEKSTHKMADQEFSPRRQVTKRPEIINVKELQNDFVGNNIHIKQEVIEEEIVKNDVREEEEEEVREDVSEKQDFEPSEKEDKHETSYFKEPQEVPSIKPIQDESNLSQTSSQASQESIASIRLPTYEKDDSHLRPSSQNSNYSFNDVIASQHAVFNKEENVCEENYEPENYDVYEQMALAYQNDVANQQTSHHLEVMEQKIETVVRERTTGEIKCDWRAGDSNNIEPTRPRRPSRWGLKPGEVNIVLTGANSHQFTNNETNQKKDNKVYQIESVLSRNDSSCSMSYDEAYMDTYGELDRLQYGDCFGEMPALPHPDSKTEETRVSTLDARIDLALKNTVLGEVARDEESGQDDKGAPEKGILVMKSLTESKGSKSVSFADGYKPGQDSDVEEPPKKKKRARRLGCPWPCPATHPDHVPLWDALPPPPPPERPPPEPARLQPPPPNNMPIPIGQMPMGPPMNPQIGSQMGQQISPQIGPQMGPQMNPQMGPMPPMGPLGPQMPMMNNIRMPQDMPMGQMPMGQQMPMSGPPMSMNGPPMSMNGPPMSMNGPPISMNGPPMSMNGPPMAMNGPPISMSQQMQINQQIQMINSMRMGQEIPMGQMQMPNQMMPPHPQMKFDPATSLPNFMPPEPPPGLITFN